MRTLAQLREDDRQATMLYFAARTARLHTLFLASGVAIGLFESDGATWRGLTPELAAPYLLKMPLLSARRAGRLKAAVPQVAAQASEAPLGRLLENVIDLHLNLSKVRRRVAARRRARSAVPPTDAS